MRKKQGILQRNQKTPLTQKGKSGNIDKLSLRIAHFSPRSHAEADRLPRKKLKNVLDKQCAVWYNNQAVAKQRREIPVSASSKKMRKWKKALDNLSQVCYDNNVQQVAEPEP